MTELGLPELRGSPSPRLGKVGLGGWGNQGIRRLLIIMKRKAISELGNILAYVAEVVW